MPTPERWPRPSHCAKVAVVMFRPCHSAKARPTASASWVPEPNPACAGKARCRRRTSRSRRPVRSRKRCRQAATRSSSARAAGVSARTASSLAPEITTSVSKPSITRPTLPKRRPSEPDGSRNPRCSRPGAHTRIAVRRVGPQRGCGGLNHGGRFAHAVLKQGSFRRAGPSARGLGPPSVRRDVSFKGQFVSPTLPRFSRT